MKNRKSIIVVYVLIIVLVLINIFPFFNLFVNSFREHRQIIANPVIFNGFTFNNYPQAEQHAGLILGVLNSFVICSSTIVILLLLGILQAYAHTFIASKLGKIIGTIITVGYFIPPTAIVLNSYLMMQKLHLIGTRTSLIIIFVSIFTPITFIILTGYMKTVPQSIIESAKIDGAGHFRTCIKIITPLCGNVIVTLIILLFLWTYREYLWPITFLSKPAQRPIAVALSMFVTDRQFDFGALSAAVIVSLFPIMALYIFLKEKIMTGVAAGAVKG